MDNQLTDLSTYTHGIIVSSLQREGLVASVLVVHDEAGEAAEAATSGAREQQRHRELFLLAHAYNTQHIAMSRTHGRTETASLQTSTTHKLLQTQQIAIQNRRLFK